MKKAISLLIATLIFLLLPNCMLAQAPDGVNYQAVVRNAIGLPLNNQTVDVRFTIHTGSSTGPAIFTETHTSITTTQFGLINIELGSVDNANFSLINWGASGPHYLQIEVDPGTGFDDLGASQLLSVPFALFSRTSGDGPQGLNSLIDTVSATAANCPTGGYEVLMGLDANANTVLELGEVTSSFFVCNGSVAGGDNWGIDTVNVSGANITGSGTVTNPLVITEVDGSITNEIQTISLNVAQDTIFLSSGGFVELPSLTADNDWVEGAGVVYNNTDRIGIGTTTPFFTLDVFSTDTVIAAFRGNNSDFSTISVSNANATGATGVLLLTTTDTAIIGIDPAQKLLVMDNSIAGGHIAINADSTVALYGINIANDASSMIYNRAPLRIFNETDSIFDYSTGGTVVHSNQGMFLTDSLYVLGNNFSTPNWVLANDGAGQAVWTDPATLTGGGSLWSPNGADVFFNTGNVGIGTNTPSSSLTIASSVGNDIEFIGGANADIVSASQIFMSSFSSTHIDATEIRLGTNALDRLTIINNGNVGIGTITPQQLFTLSTPTSTTLRLERSTGAAFDWEMNIDNLGFHLKGGADGTGGALTDFVNVDGAGRMGLGITTPSQLLHLFNGTLRIDDGVNPYNLPVADGTISGQVMTTDAAGNVTWQTPASGTPIRIIDADGDTEINVEAAPDQDVIHFSLGASTGYPGAEYFTMIGPRLEVINSGQSTFIGQGAGANDDLTTNLNTFVGYNSGNSNTTGNNNTAFGQGSLGANVIGGHNVAVGSNALNSNTSTDNAALGSHALWLNTTGTNNTAINSFALRSNLTGSGNVALGNSAMYENVLGSDNTALGTRAMYKSSGNSNVAVGREALMNLDDGDNNVAVGWQAGHTPVAVVKSGNVYLGFQAGYGDLSDDKLFIANTNTVNPLIWGDFALSLLQFNGTVNINNAYDLPNADGLANQVLTTDGLGNTTWQAPGGLSPWTDGGTILYPTTLTDSVGIGTASPLAKLHVDNGGILANWTNTGGIDANVTIVNTSGTSPGYTSGTLGAVSIVASPSAENKIAIQGHAGGDAGNKYGLRGSATGLGSNYGVDASASGGTSNNAVNAFAVAAGSSQAMGLYSTVQGTTTGNTYGVYGQNASSTTGLAYAGYFQNFSNTGTPYGLRSDVSSSFAGSQYGLYTGMNTVAAGATKYGIYTNVSGGTNNWAAYFAAGDVYINDNLVIPTGAGAGLVLTSDATGNASWGTPTAPVAFWSKTGNDVYLTDNVNDYVGIGTTQPTERLSIGAQNTATSTATQASSDRIALIGSYWNGGGEVLEDFTFQNIASPTVNELGRLGITWTGTGQELMSIESTGDVGIGTTTPSAKTHINIVSPALPALLVTNGNVTSNTSTVVQFDANSTLTNAFNLQRDGNIGIGTPSPAAKLDVIGNVKITDGTEGAGKVLVSVDATGTAQWKTNQIAFDARITGGAVVAFAPFTGVSPVNFDATAFNFGNDFDPSLGTNHFRPSVSGVYSIEATVLIDYSSAGPIDQIEMAFIHNSSLPVAKKSVIMINTGEQKTISLKATMHLNAGETVHVEIISQFGAPVNIVAAEAAWFSGHIVYED